MQWMVRCWALLVHSGPLEPLQGATFVLEKWVLSPDSCLLWGLILTGKVLGTPIMQGWQNSPTFFNVIKGH
jgi:hypothetical protein